jgi:hypothetical protein
MNITTELAVGDRILTRHGPYEAVATVVEVNDSGAVLSYAETARFVGGLPAVVPEAGPLKGRVLAEGNHGFLGRAHWPSVRRA